MGALAKSLRTAVGWIVNSTLFDFIFIVLALMFAWFQMLTNETMTMEFYLLSRQMQFYAIYIFFAEFVLRLCANGFGGWVFHDDKGSEKWMLPGCSQGSFFYDLLFYSNSRGVFVQFWTLLDLFVLIEQVVAYNNAEFPNVIVLKALSVCKILSHVSVLHIPKVLVVTAFESVTNLAPLFVSCLFWALLFAITGMNLFGLSGGMRKFCARMHLYPVAELVDGEVFYNGNPITDDELWQPMARPCTLINDSSVSSVFCDLSTPLVACDLQSASICSATAPDTVCVTLGLPVGNLLYNFENLGNALLAVVTSWYFKDFATQMDVIQRTSPGWTECYFVVCSLMGGFVLLNLTVATTAKVYTEVRNRLDDAKQQEKALIEEEKRVREQRDREYLNSLACEGTIIPHFHPETIISLWKFFLLPWLHWIYVFRTLTAIQRVLLFVRILTFNFVWLGWLLDFYKLRDTVDVANEIFTRAKVQEYLLSLMSEKKKLLHLIQSPNVIVKYVNLVLYYPLQRCCPACKQCSFSFQDQKCFSTDCNPDLSDFYKKPHFEDVTEDLSVDELEILYNKQISYDFTAMAMYISGTSLMSTINKSLRRLKRVQKIINKVQESQSSEDEVVKQMEDDDKSSEQSEESCNDDLNADVDPKLPVGGGTSGGLAAVPYFTRLTDVVILLNTFLLLFSTFEVANDMKDELAWLQFALVLFFLLECVLRLIAVRDFRVYVTEGTNLFELVLSTLNFVAFLWRISLELSNGVPSDTAVLLAATRIFQLMKLFMRYFGEDSYLPVWKVLMKGFGSLKHVFAAIFVNCCFLLVFSFIGIELFGGCIIECEKSEYNGNAGIYTGVGNPFTALHTAFVALFLLSTGDLFTSYIFYGDRSNIFGILYWIVFYFLGNYIFLRIFVALIVYNYDIPELERRKIQRSHARWAQLNANEFETSEFIKPSSPPQLQKIITANLLTSLNSISDLIDYDNKDEYEKKEYEWIEKLALQNIAKEQKAATAASSPEEMLLINSLSVMYTILKPVKEGDSDEAVREQKRKLKLRNSPEFSENCRQMADRIADFIGIPPHDTFDQESPVVDTMNVKQIDAELCGRLKGGNGEGMLVLEVAIQNTNPALIQVSSSADSIRRLSEEKRLRRYLHALKMLDIDQSTKGFEESSFKSALAFVFRFLKRTEKWAFNMSVYELSFLNGYSLFDLVALVIILFSIYLSITKSSGQLFMNSVSSTRAVEYFLVFFFVFEIVLRGLANGWNTPTELAKQNDIDPVFRDPGKIIDFFVIFLMVLDTIFRVAIPDSIMVLRILKLLPIMRNLRVGQDEDTPWVDAPIKSLFDSISNSLDELACIFIFLLCVIILFSYIVTTLYPAGAFEQCNDDGTEHLEECVGVKFDQNGYGYLSCRYSAGFNQFGLDTNNFYEAMKTLFHVLSQDGWGTILDATMQSSGSIFWRWEAVIPFFLFFMFTYLTSVFVSQLFIGTFIFNIRLAQGDGLFTITQQRWAATRKNLGKYLKYHRDKVAPTNWRKWLYKLSESVYFQHLMTFIIIANVVLMASETYPSVPQYASAAVALNSIFLALFIIELISKLLGYQFDTIAIFGMKFTFIPKTVWSDSWVQFDIIVTIMSIVDIWLIPLLDVSPVNFITAMRSLRLIRLVKKYHGLQLVCSTMWKGLPVILAGFSLMFLWSVIFGTIAVEFFGKIKEGIVISPTNNFSTFSSSLILMFRIMCGDGWWGLLADVSISKPHCSGPDCGHDWAAWFLVVYWLGHSLIFTPLLIASLIQYFTQETSDDDSYVKQSDCQKCVEVWKLYEKLVQPPGNAEGNEDRSGKSEHPGFEESYKLKLMHLKPLLCALKDKGCVLGFDPSNSSKSRKKYEEVEMMIVAKVVASFWNRITRDKSPSDPASPEFRNPHAICCSSCCATKASDSQKTVFRVCKFFKTNRDIAANVEVDDTFDGALLYRSMSSSDLFNRWKKIPGSDDISGWDEYQRERKFVMGCEILDFDTVCYVLASFLNEKESLSSVDFLNEDVGTESMLKQSVYKHKNTDTWTRAPEELIENFRMQEHSLSVIEHRFREQARGPLGSSATEDDSITSHSTWAEFDREMIEKHSRIQHAIDAGKIAESLAPSRPLRIIARNFGFDDDSFADYCPWMDFGAFVNGVYVLSDQTGLSRLVYNKLRSNQDMNSFCMSMHVAYGTEHKVTVMSAPASVKKPNSVQQCAVFSCQQEAIKFFADERKVLNFMDDDDFDLEKSDSVMFSYSCSLECFRSYKALSPLVAAREDWTPKNAMTSEGTPVAEGDLCWVFSVTFSDPELISNVSKTNHESPFSKTDTLKLPLAICWSRCDSFSNMNLPTKVQFPLHPTWYILKADTGPESVESDETASDPELEDEAAITDSRCEEDDGQRADCGLVKLHVTILQKSQSAQLMPDELVFKLFDFEAPDDDIECRIPEAFVSEPLQRIILSGCGSLQLDKGSSNVLPFVNMKDSGDIMKPGDCCYAYRKDKLTHMVARVMNILNLQFDKNVKASHHGKKKYVDDEVIPPCEMFKLVFDDGLFVDAIMMEAPDPETLQNIRIVQIVEGRKIPVTLSNSIIFCDYRTPETSLKKCVIDGEYSAIQPDPGMTLSQYKRVGTKHQVSINYEPAPLKNVTVYKIRNQRGKCARFCCMFPHGLKENDVVQDFDLAFRRNIHFLTFFKIFRTGFERAYYEHKIDANFFNSSKVSCGDSYETFLTSPRRLALIQDMKQTFQDSEKTKERADMEKWIVAHALEVWNCKRKEAELKIVEASSNSLSKEELHSKVNALLSQNHKTGTSIKEKRVANNRKLPPEFRDLFVDQIRGSFKNGIEYGPDGVLGFLNWPYAGIPKPNDPLDRDNSAFDPFCCIDPETGKDVFVDSNKPAFQSEAGGMEYLVVDVTLTEFSLVPEPQMKIYADNPELCPRIQFKRDACACSWFPEGFPDGFTLYAADATVSSNGGPPLPVNIECSDGAAVPVPFCEYLFQCVPETFEGWVIDGRAAKLSGPFLQLDVPQYLSTLNDYDTCIDPFCVQFHEQRTTDKDTAPWILMHGTDEQLREVLELLRQPFEPFEEKPALRNRLRRYLNQPKHDSSLASTVQDDVDSISSFSNAARGERHLMLKDYGVFHSNCANDAGEKEFSGEWTFCRGNLSFPETALRVFPVNATYELIRMRENLWDDYVDNVCALSMDGYVDDYRTRHDGILDQILEWAISVESLSTADSIICHWSAPAIDAGRAYFDCELSLPAGASLALPEIKGESWLDSPDALHLLDYGLPISTLSSEQLTIKKEQSVVKKNQLKGRRKSQLDDVDASADGAVIVSISPSSEPPANQNPFAQLSNSILSPFSRAGSSLTSSVMSMFEMNSADGSRTPDASQKAHRRKKRLSVAERLSCAAPRDSEGQPSAPKTLKEHGIFSAVFAACGGTQHESESVVNVTAPPSDSLENVVAVRRQKKVVRKSSEGKQRNSNSADEGAFSMDEIDV
jgi:hypothetical protein